jgi:16S rRNA processing protein RimM
VSGRIRVARIGAAHGVRGEVKLWSFTQDPMAVADYGPLETEDGAQRFEIETLRPAKDFMVARLKGVADRDAATKLCNLELFVARDKLPPIEDDDTYYHADLVGMAAITPEGVPLGNVTAIHNFGAGDLIEVRPDAGNQTQLVPFDAMHVPTVDIAAGKIVVEFLEMDSETAPATKRGR